MSAPNLNSSTSTYGTASLSTLTTSPINILSNSQGSNSLVKAQQCIVNNMTMGTIALTAAIYNSGTSSAIALMTSQSVPALTSVAVPVGGLNLLEGQNLQLTASVGGCLAASASAMVMS